MSKQAIEKAAFPANRWYACMYCTANPIIIDVRYHDFNAFPVGNWYQKPLKAENR